MSTAALPSERSSQSCSEPSRPSQPESGPAQALRLGTRGSQLALTQSNLVAELLREQGLPVTLKQIRTEGDVSRASLAQLGGVGVFAAKLRQALLDNACDLAVHSYKDLPSVPATGLQVWAVPQRADPRDCLCASNGLTLAELPEKAKVGTGSPRRAAQLLALRPDLEIVDIRGNVPTRLGRVRDIQAPQVDLTGNHAETKRGDLDAVVLAAAGLDRLGLSDYITERFSPEQFLPAASQGALAVEARADLAQVNLPAAQAIKQLNHLPSELSVLAERSLLLFLEAGCAAPLGVFAHLRPLHTYEPGTAGPDTEPAAETGPEPSFSFISEGEDEDAPQVLELRAAVFSATGHSQVQAQAEVVLHPYSLVAQRDQAWALGAEVGKQLLDAGAEEICSLH